MEWFVDGIKYSDYSTLLWDGTIQYGPFTATNWYAIGGPNHPLFKTLLDRFKSEIPELRDYELYTIGGLIEEWISWDIDLFLLGKYDPPTIRNMLYQMHKIAFDLHLYIDLHFTSSLWVPRKDENGNYEKFWTHNYELSNLFVRDEIRIDLSEYEEIDGLWRMKHYLPYQKHIERLESGTFYKPPVKLL